MPIFFLAPLLLLFLSSCSSVQQGIGSFYGANEFVLDSYKIRQGKFAILEMEGEESEPLLETFLQDYPETISSGDVLSIILYHPERADISASIAEINRQVGFPVIDRVVRLPDINPIIVEGLTLFDAQQKIERAYAKELPDVELFVTYRHKKEKRVDLAGLVSLSSVVVDGTTRLFDVLAQAKIPPEANLFKSYVLREAKMLSVDLYKLLKQGDMSQNIVMHGGDKIYIAEPSAASLMVMGEVGVERVIDLPSGSISLRKALAEARGIPFTGDKSYIQVIRGNIAQPKIYLLNWEHVIHLPNDSLLLMPGDIVYVASKPITEWNRFISQLLPTSMGIEVFQKSFNNIGVILP